MKRSFMLCMSVVVLGVTWVATAVPAAAAAPIPGAGGSTTFGVLPAGVACPFAVSIDLVGGGKGQSLTFLDQNGDLARLMIFARPSTWEITNLESGDSVTVTIPAAQWRIVPSSDGTTTIFFSGGVIGFNSPADTPPGPFSLTNAGRIVFVVAANGTGTLQVLHGRTTDLCAAVAG